jgi:hypothetical protein
MASDVHVYRRGREMSITQGAGNAPRHPLADCEADVLLTEARFQDVGCPNCQRVRQDAVWWFRCGRCHDTWLAFGCADCGGAGAASERYQEHRRIHG